tara:strand:- start:226 stop:627 length:402 start_codon:yes stop_codon:yes gene_type:complete
MMRVSNAGDLTALVKLDIPALSNPVQVSTGDYHTCAVDAAGVQCWGSNSNGQTDVPALSNPVQVSTGDYHTCAVDDAGVQCWGDTSQGQFVTMILLLGVNSASATDLPLRTGLTVYCLTGKTTALLPEICVPS